MVAFLHSPAAAGRDDYTHLLASPGTQPWGVFGSPAPAAQSGCLSFDVLASPDAIEGDATLKVRTASHLELFVFAAAERGRVADEAATATTNQQQQDLAALTHKVVAKTLQAKHQEVTDLVASVASKYGLPANYSKAEETIKAVWAEQTTKGSHARSAVATMEEPTLGKNSSDHVSTNEEPGQHATSSLKVTVLGNSSNSRKRTLDHQPSFTFPAPVPTAGDDEAAGHKRRRVQYGRMRELETEVQRQRHLNNALNQSLDQAEAQHTAALLENEQLWNALLHIRASLRAAHAAQLRQQVAMHAAAMAAVLPAPPPVPEIELAAVQEVDLSVNLIRRPIFTDEDELAAACGMFISPAKPLTMPAADNKPRQLFKEGLEGAACLEACDRPLLPLDDLPLDLAALWMHAA